MVEHRPLGTLITHLLLILGVAIIALPLYVGFVGSTLSFDQVTTVPMQLTPGTHLVENYAKVLKSGSTAGSNAPVGQMMLNSLVMALAIAIGKIAISILSAFAIVYFRFPLRYTFFWMIFVTLMLPVEVRIFLTYKVVADLGMVNTYWGLTLPLIASATATFLFRQFFLTVPDELAEAARIDGAGPMRFFFDTFAIVDAATSGGPVQATSILVFKVYQDGVQALDLSGSAAQSVILMAIVIALTVIQFRYVERKVQY